MSRIGSNPLLIGVSGMLGKAMVFRQLHGKTIMSNRPRRSAITPHQEIMKSRFQRAVQYAKQQIQIPERKAMYAAGINDRKHSAYAVALTDCMTPPEIKSINVSDYKGNIGDLIIIHAVDDFKVTEVNVTIVDNSGNTIEQGNAVLPLNAIEEWYYAITKTNSTLAGTHILAKAMDQPGNVGERKVIIS